jgi:hypothetical protein
MPELPSVRYRMSSCAMAPTQTTLVPGTGTRDHRFDLLGREVLGLVDDQELVDERAAAHEIQVFRLDLRLDQVARSGYRRLSDDDPVAPAAFREV